MTRQVLFNGAVLVRAGGATKVDASAFQNVGVTGVGIVGLIGEADGGEPNSVQLFRDPRSMVDAFRSGPLADAADLAFRPMNDTRVPGGASAVVAVKVNQAARSSKALMKSTANMMTITSIDYGAHTLKVSVEVATSGGGKTVEFVFEDSTVRRVESSPVLGATAEFTIQYTGAGASCTMTVSPTQITTTVAAGPGGEDLTIPFSTYSTLNEIINFINNSAGGVYTATAVTKNPYAFLGSDLDRVTAVDIATGVTSFYAKLYRMIDWVNSNSALVTATRAASTATGATAGTHTGSVNAPFNLEPGQDLTVVVDGGAPATATFDAVAAVHTGAAATYAALNGKTLVFEIDDDGDTQTVTFTAGATNAASTAAEFNAQARNCRMIVNGTETDIYSDLRGTDSSVAINASSTALVETGHAATTASGTGDVANINAVTHVEAKAVIEADVGVLLIVYTPATGSGTPATLTSLTTGIASSIQVSGGTARTAFGFDTNIHIGTAAGAAGGTEAPDDVGPVFLTGGARGTSTNTNWQDGFDLLGKVLANVITPLASEDLANEGYGSTATFASIAAMTDSHAAYYSSTKGKSEREAYIGMKGTKTQLLAMAGTLQSPHSLLFGQVVTRGDHSGSLAEFPEWGEAVIAASGRAGSVLGEPLVHKNLRASGLSQDTSWNPEDDGDDMILGGVTFAFAPPNGGFKFDRVITTYTKLDNDAYVEESVVMGWKNVTYGLRTQIEAIFTGVRGLPLTVEGVKDATRRILDAYRDEGQIVDSVDADGNALRAWRELKVNLSGDVNSLSVVISPVSGINFELQTVFLVPASIAA